ncbi:hypothetical protein Trydic_g10950 [Trypoxylus dichotomus]
MRALRRRASGRAAGDCLVCETCKMPRANICESSPFASYASSAYVQTTKIRNPPSRSPIFLPLEAFAKLATHDPLNDKGLIMDILYHLKREELVECIDGGWAVSIVQA